jgi:DNA (cytosine-5)-methyltransferase 1
MTTAVINTSIGESRSLPRLWLEGQKLAAAGIKIGVRYCINVTSALKRVELRPAPDDYQGQTFLVSKRERNNIVSPLIEIRTDLFKEVFELGSKVRVTIRQGRIVIAISHIANRIAERVKRFLDKLQGKEPLAVVSLFHGGGVLDKAMHSGLQKAGVNSFVQVGVELESEFIDASLRNNPELWTEESTIIQGDIREINLLGGNIPQCDAIFAGIPCTGASRAGASKNKLSCAEEHSEAGSMFVDFLDWVKASNPGIVVIENVPEYSKSSSMMVIRSKLTTLGYVLSEVILDGNEMGALEKRCRMCVVGITPGIGNPFDFGQLAPMRQKEACLADILEDVPLDSDRWKSYDYLADKAERDLAAGKGFKRQLLDGNAVSCGTIGKDYMKGRSTEPFIIHPENPSLSRLLTPEEHARVKAAPNSLIHGLAPTTQHQLLGQAVVFTAFEAVGYLLGLTIQGLTKVVEKVTNVIEIVSPAMNDSASYALEEDDSQSMRLFA